MRLTLCEKSGWGILVAVLVLFSADQAPSQEATRAQLEALTPEKAANARSTIVRWIECEECTEGQLEGVLKLGGVAVPTLTAILRNGASPASHEMLRRQLEKTYKKLKQYERTHPEAKVDLSEEDYVRTYLGNYDALHRVRAAEALARIGGQDARAAVQDALRQPLRPDVMTRIKEFAERM